MKYIKCTRCELNYHTEEEIYCMVCKRELSGEDDAEDCGQEGDICPFCEENVLGYGDDMCAACAAVHNQRAEGEQAEVMQKIRFIEIDK